MKKLTELVGNTPMVVLDKMMPKEGVTLLAKLEGTNQGLREAGRHRVDGRSKDEPDDDRRNQCERQASKEHLGRAFHDDF